MQAQGWSYKLQASFSEIYNNKLIDLLDDDANAASDKSLEIKRVDNKTVVPVRIFSPHERLCPCLLGRGCEDTLKPASACAHVSYSSSFVFFPFPRDYDLIFFSLPFSTVFLSRSLSVGPDQGCGDQRGRARRADGAQHAQPRNRMHGCVAFFCCVSLSYAISLTRLTGAQASRLVVESGQGTLH